MRPGFLLIETREDRPSRVRIRTTSQLPSTDEQIWNAVGALALVILLGLLLLGF